jgi:hypothetical protein
MSALGPDVLHIDDSEPTKLEDLIAAQNLSNVAPFHFTHNPN